MALSREIIYKKCREFSTPLISEIEYSVIDSLSSATAKTNPYFGEFGFIGIITNVVALFFFGLRDLHLVVEIELLLVGFESKCGNTRVPAGNHSYSFYGDVSTRI